MPAFSTTAAIAIGAGLAGGTAASNIYSAKKAGDVNEKAIEAQQSSEAEALRLEEERIRLEAEEAERRERIFQAQVAADEARWNSWIQAQQPYWQVANQALSGLGSLLGGGGVNMGAMFQGAGMPAAAPGLPAGVTLPVGQPGTVDDFRSWWAANQQPLTEAGWGFVDHPREPKLQAPGGTFIDVIRGAGAPGSAFQWLPEGGGRAGMMAGAPPMRPMGPGGAPVSPLAAMGTPVRGQAMGRYPLMEMPGQTSMLSMLPTLMGISQLSGAAKGVANPLFGRVGSPGWVDPLASTVRFNPTYR